MIARQYSIKKMADFKRERWGEGGCDVIQSRHQNKRGYISMQERGVRGLCLILPCVFLSSLALEKIMLSSHYAVLIR